MLRNSIPLLILIICIAALTLSSCDQNTPEDIVLLRTDRFTEFKADHVESWVLISDRQGQILDMYKTSEEEGVLEFEGLTDGSITVTEVSVASFDINGATRLQHSVRTHLGVPAGETYLLEQRDNGGVDAPFPDTLGRAHLTLNNYTESDDPYFSIAFSDSYNGFNTWLDYSSFDYDGSTITTGMILRESPTDLLISTYQDNIPVYTWLNDVKVGDTVEANFLDFSPMKQIQVNKPVTHSYIQGQIEPELGGRGYTFTSTDNRRYHNDYDPEENVPLGYLDGFETYDTYVLVGPICCESHQNVTYHKLGSSVPESVQMPEFRFELLNGNVYDLDFTFDKTYSYASFFFELKDENNTLFWEVNAEKGEQWTVPSLPSEITAKYPYLDRDELYLTSLRFTDNLDGFTYEDQLARDFELPRARTDFERFQYYIRF